MFDNKYIFMLIIIVNSFSIGRMFDHINESNDPSTMFVVAIMFVAILIASYGVVRKKKIMPEKVCTKEII